MSCARIIKSNGTKNVKTIHRYTKCTQNFLLKTLKDDVDKELCWEENIKTDHKEEGCVAVTWINLAHYCNKWRILLNVLMDIQAP